MNWKKLTNWLGSPRHVSLWSQVVPLSTNLLTARVDGIWPSTRFFWLFSQTIDCDFFSSGGKEVQVLEQELQVQVCSLFFDSCPTILNGWSWISNLLNSQKRHWRGCNSSRLCLLGLRGEQLQRSPDDCSSEALWQVPCNIILLTFNPICIKRASRIFHFKCWPIFDTGG